MEVGSIFLIRGLIGMVAGMLAMFWPALTITFLVLLFGAYAFIDGVTNVAQGLRGTPSGRPSWAALIQGVVGIAAGVLAFIWPGITALALVLWVGAWALVTGIFEIAAAIRLRRVIQRGWLLVVSGVLSIVFGIVLFAFPAIGAVGLAWALGAYAMASGIVLAALGIRLRSVPPVPA